MHVLSVIHGTDARTELFAPAIADSGHELDEWSFGWGTPPPRPLDCYDAVLVFGGAMHADQDDHHPWLGEETMWLQQLLAPAHAGARRVPRRAAPRARGGRVGRAHAGRPGARLVPGRADRRRRRRSRARRRCRATFEALQWHHYTYGAPGGRRRARAQPRVHAGVPARRRVLGRAVPSRGDGGAARGLDRRRLAIRRPIPTALRAEIPQKIGAWNDLGRSLCAAFLTAAERRAGARTRPPRTEQ